MKEKLLKKLKKKKNKPKTSKLRDVAPIIDLLERILYMQDFLHITLVFLNVYNTLSFSVFALL